MPTSTRVRELRGQINRSKRVFAWVPITEGDVCPLEISKAKAKELCDFADENEIAEMMADEHGKAIYIGDVEASEKEEEGGEEEAAEEAGEEDTRFDEMSELLGTFESTQAFLEKLAEVVSEEFDDAKGAKLITEFAAKFEEHEKELR